MLPGIGRSDEPLLPVAPMKSVSWVRSAGCLTIFPLAFMAMWVLMSWLMLLARLKVRAPWFKCRSRHNEL